MTAIVRIIVDPVTAFCSAFSLDPLTVNVNQGIEAVGLLFQPGQIVLTCFLSFVF